MTSTPADRADLADRAHRAIDTVVRRASELTANARERALTAERARIADGQEMPQNGPEAT